MSDILSEFRAVAAKRYQTLTEWKRDCAGKIIGCVPMHFPEELVAAAGAFPLLLLEGDQPVTQGHQHIAPFFCGYTRSNIDLAVKDELNFLDGLIVLDTCLQMRGLWAVLNERLSLPFNKFIQFPAAVKQPYALTLVQNELADLRSQLEEFSGYPIDDESIRRAISTYNRNRALLRQLYDLRLAKPGLLSAKDMASVITAGTLMPKEEHSALLEKLISQLKERQVAGAQPIRLFVSGHLCYAPQDYILDLIEEVGTIVVDDDLYTGRRYCSRDADVVGDPVEALARRHTDRALPCPTLWDQENSYADYLVTAAKASRAQGVVILLVKFCEPHMFAYPELKQALSAARIPHLTLETEHEVVSLGQTKTRLQAFVEMIQAAA